ncbi:MAG: NUDIX hydrolase family protein [Actinobacteria bacterium]|nr:NUDIX hydrolase family protein [Actinomycetota bacterium]
MADITDITQAKGGWLAGHELEQVRGQLPVVYIDALPVRVDPMGEVDEVGLLLRGTEEGQLKRSMVSGRVHVGERIRDALLRHLEKDLGPMALPRIPASPAPFTVVEYFPDPDVTGFHDPRQHAVSLAFVVPVDGDCEPSQEALDLSWLSPSEAMSPEITMEMDGGRDKLLQMALAHCGVLP